MNINNFLNTKVFTGIDSREAKNKQLIYAIKNLKTVGHILEFGVFQGASINLIADNCNCEVFGFDSFEGLPEKWNIGATKYSKGHFACDIPEVRNNVILYPGWFSDTIKIWKKDNPYPGQISFLHIDCDLYSSTSYILKKLNDRIVPGTLICFDELCDFRLLQNPKARKHNLIPRKVYYKWAEGEWKALNEWLKKYSRKVKPISRTYAQSSLVEVIK